MKDLKFDLKGKAWDQAGFKAQDIGMFFNVFRCFHVPNTLQFVYQKARNVENQYVKTYGKSYWPKVGWILDQAVRFIPLGQGVALYSWARH